MRIDWNMAGFRELRYSGNARAVCETYGRAVEQLANSTLQGGQKGYRMSSRAGARKPQGRWRVSIAAVSTYARRSNARHNTLVKLLSAR